MLKAHAGGGMPELSVKNDNSGSCSRSAGPVNKLLPAPEKNRGANSTVSIREASLVFISGSKSRSGGQFLGDANQLSSIFGSAISTAIVSLFCSSGRCKQRHVAGSVDGLAGHLLGVLHAPVLLQVVLGDARLGPHHQARLGLRAGAAEAEDCLLDILDRRAAMLGQPLASDASMPRAESTRLASSLLQMSAGRRAT